MNLNDIYDEVKSRLNSENTCGHSIQNVLSSLPTPPPPQSSNVIYKRLQFYPLIYMDMKIGLLR
jgi:hypothetical protein